MLLGPGATMCCCFVTSLVESTQRVAQEMGHRFNLDRVALAILAALFCAATNAQTPDFPSNFDARAIESATVISGGICSNQVIGISYQLPEGMRPEDAAAMRLTAREGEMARTGIGPEAGYFLFGYAESKTAAMLCGAANKDGQVQVIATSATALKTLGPHPLEQLVEGIGQALGAQPSKAVRESISGSDFERADAHAQLNSPVRGRIQIWGSTYAAQVNSYVVMWNLVGYSQKEWKQLIAGMNSLKFLPPQPISGPASPGAVISAVTPTPVAPDFQVRLNAFLSAWLKDRDRPRTMAFFDSAAFSAPPLIGSYCDGWYKKSTPPKQAAQIVAQNLMGVPGDFPKKTAPSAIFTAWDHLPPQWVTASSNNLAKDHFLVVRLDTESLGRIFSGVFAGSNYDKFAEGRIAKGGTSYWVVFPEIMPDGDIFVIFTLWQKSSTTWNIVDVDVVCQ
jgi:hypothetical protein